MRPLSIMFAFVFVSVSGCDDDPPPPPSADPPPETEPAAETDPSPEEPSGDPLPERRPTLALGGVHTCDLNAEGEVRCWGSDQFGQLGDPDLARDYDAHRASPALVAGLDGIRALYVGNFHSCVVGDEHAVRCWGHDGFGQSGGTTREDALSPRAIDGLDRPVELALGRQHTCARLADRQVMCFGDNGWGQLGDGTNEARSSPVAVSGVTDAIAISAGRDHTCALREGGGITCWGAAVDGQLGAAAPADAVSGGPLAIEEVPDDVTAISAGGLHTCVLAAGRVYCWGANDAHQMGNARGGEQDDRVGRPGAVLDLEGVVEIAMGGRHGCARKDDGTVYCWGANHFGQLGDGTQQGESRPVKVRGLDDATSIAAGVRHTCVHRRRGDQVCWGANRLGQLGDGTEEKISVGVIVGGGGRIAEPDEEPARRGRHGVGMGMGMGMGAVLAAHPAGPEVGDHPQPPAESAPTASPSPTGTESGN